MNFGPNIIITKGQLKVLKSKGSLKEYIYSIMGMLWSRDVLCSHSMTGKSSNAFKDKDAKPQLDKEKVQSICGKLFKIVKIVQYWNGVGKCRASNLLKVNVANCYNISFLSSTILEYGAKRFGYKVEDVRKVMIARISNVVKVEKAKERAQK